MFRGSIIKFFIFCCFTLSVVGCATDGADGVDGADGSSVNADSLAVKLRTEITETLWDSLKSEPFVDSVYSSLFNSAFSQAWLDSARQLLKDSLIEDSYDSLYKVLYDSVYYDIYSKSVTRDLVAYIYAQKDDLYTSYANLYSLMYTGYRYPVPLAVAVQNSGTVWRTILVKAWIPDFSDTGSVTTYVNPDSLKLFGPTLNLLPEAYLGLTAAKPVQVQVRAYALENNREILIFSEAYPVIIHPVQIRGAEYVGIDTYPWDAVWVTPNMDSITALHTNLSSRLPSGTILGYQAYSGKTVEESVTMQVQAVYEMLTAKKISYVNNPDAGSIGQKIKYPIEVLRTHQANCIEGTFLFASILESIGIQVFIVHIPGHAFIGWRTTRGGNTLNFLETTQAWGDAPATYEQANVSGIDKYNAQVTAGNFADSTSRLIDIAESRTLGILPNDIP